MYTAVPRHMPGRSSVEHSQLTHSYLFFKKIVSSRLRQAGGDHGGDRGLRAAHMRTNTALALVVAIVVIFAALAPGVFLSLLDLVNLLGSFF